MSDSGSAIAGVVAAANNLAAGWAATCGEGSVVMAGVSAWPLLALLAAAAAGRGRRELGAAVGVDAGQAHQAARTVLEILGGSPAIRTALGLWNQRNLTLRDEWLKTLPGRTHGELTGDPRIDRPRLDAWASEQTGGLIPTMPITVDERTLLVLASALTVRSTWREPFDEDTDLISTGPWAGQKIRALRRLTHIHDHARVAGTPNGPLTMFQVVGDAGIDVLLILGEQGQSAAGVLTTGISVLTRRSPRTPVHALPGTHPGPGITIDHIDAYRPDPQLNVMVPPFTIRSDHDLLDHPEVFGLATVTDPTRGHFPAISDQPLAISKARQSCTASFQARGFEAAAITATSMRVSRAPAPSRPPYRAKRINITFDRPFGFLNIHQKTGLILTAGWIAEPPQDRQKSQ